MRVTDLCQSTNEYKQRPDICGAACRYGKQALSAMYRTIVGRRDAGESGVTPDFMAEALAKRELATGTPEWSAARLAAFKVKVNEDETRIC
jgi:hypothetical protein